MKQTGIEQHLAKIGPGAKNDFRGFALGRLLFPFIKGRRVLDAGCGAGYFLSMIQRPGVDVTGYDASPDMIALCQENFRRWEIPGVHLSPCSVEAMQDHAVYDTVVLLDVLEHLSDDEAGIKRLHRALTPEGRLIVSVPAYPWLYGPRDKALGHHRRYSKAALLKVIRDGGFVIEKTFYWNKIGLVPTMLSAKVLKRPFREGFRYEGRSWIQSLGNTLLRWWFVAVENALGVPPGLTLVVLARKG